VIEVANGLADKNRPAAVDFIDRAYKTANTHVVPLNRKLVRQATELYRARTDKEWGLMDCISFTVMQQHRLAEALKTDHHFKQAGFKVLLPGE
jgi:predicted nucleic acid-binding protein